VASQILAKTWQGLISSQDEFRTAGLRVAGSIDQMVTNANNLQANLGLTREQANAAVKALAEVGFTQKEMQKLAVSHAMFTKATGASAGETAKFQKRLQAVTGSAEEAAKVTDEMTVAARRYGVTGSELDNIMAKYNSEILTLQSQYSMSDKAAGKFASGLVKIQGAAKRAGVEADKMIDILTDMGKDPLKNIILMGRHYNEFVDAMKSGDAGKQMEVTGKMAKDALDRMKGMGEIQKRIYAQNVYKKSIGELEQMVKTAEKMKEMEALGGGDAIKASEVFKESLGTLTEQIGRLSGVVLGLVSSALQPFLIVLVKLLQAVNWIVGHLADAVTATAEWLDEIGLGGTILKWVLKTLAGFVILLMVAKWTGLWAIGLSGLRDKLFGMVQGIWAAIGGLKNWLVTMKSTVASQGGLWASFTKGLTSLKDWAKGAKGAGKQVADTASKMKTAAATGPAAGKGMKQAGEGFKSFGKSIADIPWSAVWKIGVILGMLIIAIFGLVLAAKLLGEQGVAPMIAVSVALIALSIAVYFIIAALIALSAAAGPVAPGLLILAAVMAILVLSAIGLAFAFSLIAGAAKDVDWINMAVGIWMMVPAMVLLGYAMWGVVTAFVALAAAMAFTFFTGNPFAKIAGPMSVIGESLKGVDFDAFTGVIHALNNADVNKANKIAEAFSNMAWAMAYASLFGSSNALAETITTVKTTDDTGKQAKEDRRAKEQDDRMKELISKVDSLVDAFGSENVDAIKNLLETYLPKMTKKDDLGLSGTSWG
jgi:hypothetical protein